MSEDQAVSEIEKYRDRLVASRDKATETVSSTLRSVSFGLSIALYGFIFNSSENSIWKGFEKFFLIAAVFGVLAAVFDILQSLLERKSSSSVLEYLRANRECTEFPEPKFLECYRNTHGGRGSAIALWARTFCVVVGCISIILAVTQAVATKTESKCPRSTTSSS